MLEAFCSKALPKGDVWGEIVFCLFVCLYLVQHLTILHNQLYIYNTILYNTSPFILSYFSIWSMHILRHSFTEWAISSSIGSNRGMRLFPGAEDRGKDKVGKYTGPSFSSRGRSGLKNPGGVTLGNTQWRQAWLLSRGTNLVGIRGKSFSEIRENMLPVVWLKTTLRRRVWYGNGRLFFFSFFSPTVETRGLIAWSKDPLEIKRG